jgi:hypothetical protein
MLMMTSPPAAATSCRTRPYRVGSQVTRPASSRTWIWTIAAPAARQASAAAAISSTVVGRDGFCAFVGQEPVVATEMINGSLTKPAPPHSAVNRSNSPGILSLTSLAEDEIFRDRTEVGN